LRLTLPALYRRPNDKSGTLSNALAFINLLQALEPHEGEMISKLRTMARYQLEAMSYCIGKPRTP